jgi:hypothetical protein
MADAAQRQRKLAAKAARRKQVVAQRKKTEAVVSSVPARVRLAAQGRIVRCIVPADFSNGGMGTVIVARAMPSGLLGCAFFLLDVFGLGVKDAFFREMSERELRVGVEQQAAVQEFREAEPAHARKLIREAIAYAARLKRSPAKNTAVIEAIFGDVNPDDCECIYTFGGPDGSTFPGADDDGPSVIEMMRRVIQQTLTPEEQEMLAARIRDEPGDDREDALAIGQDDVVTIEHEQSAREAAD